MNFQQILPVGTSIVRKKIPAKLNWQKNKVKTLDLELSQAELFQSSPHHWFNKMLRLNDICDIETIEIPGAIIMLSWGTKIAERFAKLIRDQAENNAYAECSYPSLIPKNIFQPMSDLIDFSSSILSISSDYALVPTGEYSIYHHWQSLIKNKFDLPKKIFQRTKYFRPISSKKRSGSSVFLSMEACDVYEFHSAFANNALAASESYQLMTIFKNIAEQIGTTVLWSLRPTWTNRGNLYNWSFGGDAILPSKHTVQIASAYYQGDVFSKRFNITYNHENQKNYTEQATGAITRRLIFANLFQTIRKDGSLCLHPNIAPIQLVFMAVDLTAEDKAIINNINNELINARLRIKLIFVENKKQFYKEEKNWHNLGIPLKILYFGRAKFDSTKLIIIRNDTKHEYHVQEKDISKTILLALEDVKNFSYNNLKDNMITDCQNLEEAYAVLQEHRIASLPLSIEPQSIKKLEELKKGEVLGFYSNETVEPCAVSGKNVSSRAFVSRRI